MPDETPTNQDPGPPADNGGDSTGKGGGKDPQSLWEILNAPDKAKSARSTPTQTDDAVENAAVEDSQGSGVDGRELHPEDYIPQDSAEETVVSTDSSRIQRILSNPDAVETETAAAGVVDTDDDFDAAVRHYNERESLAVNCRKHPDRHAADFCPQCEAYYCQNCMVIRRGKLLCEDCADTLFTPSEEEIIRAQELGMDMPQAEITPEEPPEFEVSGALFGVEGRPASPLKRLGALLIDLLITRVIYIILFFILGWLFTNMPSPAFHLFDKVDGISTSMRIFNALLLFRPPLPWLMIVAVLDFLYFFISLSFANRTSGMSWAGCRIVTEWGDFVPFGAVALRTLVFMVFLGIPAVILAFFFPAFRGPHDYVAGTVVINYSGVKRIDAYENIQIKL